MDFLKVGQFIRKVRKERGMTLDDLADEYIPRATLSSIERGISKNPTKINYLLRKLDIHLTDLSKKEREEAEERNLDLMILENKINREPASVLKKLNRLSTDYHGALFDFLKGRCYFKLKQDTKAIECFKESLRKLDSEIDSEKTNIKSFCLNHLAIMSFNQNNYELALQHTEEGIAVFDLNGEHQHLYTTLLSNQSIYLWNLGKTEEALKTIEQIKVTSFDLDMDTVIGIYDFQAVLKLEIKMYEDAFACAKKGLELAHINDNYERQLELYITLGEIYKSIDLPKRAEKCFLSAINLQDVIVKRHQIILNAYLNLGILYYEQQKYVQSQKILEKATQIAKKQNNMLKYTKTMFYLAKNYLSNAKFDAAIHSFMEILHHSIDDNTKREVYSGLAQVYLYLEDDENYLKYSKQYFSFAKLS